MGLSIWSALGMVVSLGFALASTAHAANYALVLGGASKVPAEIGPEDGSHDFASDTYQTAAGLHATNWQTTVLFSPRQGEGKFRESPAIESLRPSGIDVKGGDKPTVLAAFADLEKKIKPGDKVFLALFAHGGAPRGEFSFGLADPSSSYTGVDVKQEELTDLIKRLKKAGAQVAVELQSCHSGDYSQKLAAELREDAPGQKPVCFITSAFKKQNSENCMESDFEADGTLSSPHNKAYTSATSFVGTWLYRHGKSEPDNAITRGRCWPLKLKHYDACLVKAQKHGIPTGPGATLKDLMRAGRLCDQTMNFPDWTGKQRALEPIIQHLATQSQLFVYAYSSDPRNSMGQINPFNTSDLLTRAKDAEKAITALQNRETSGYEKELATAAMAALEAYKVNLKAQKGALEKYQAILDRPFDVKALRAILGDVVGKMEALWKAEHTKIYHPEAPNQSTQHADPQTPPTGNPGIPPVPTFEMRDRMTMIHELQRYYAYFAKTDADKAKIAKALAVLNGDEEGSQALKALVALQEKQHALFQQFIETERTIYDRNLGKQASTCDGFDLEAK